MVRDGEPANEHPDPTNLGSAATRRGVLRLAGAAGAAVVASVAGAKLLTQGDEVDGVGREPLTIVAGASVEPANTSEATAAAKAETDPAMPRAPTVFGVNCYDLYYMPFRHGLAHYDPLPRLQAMKDAGIKFVRMSASPFWPDDWKAWDADPSFHFAVLDRVFAAAEQVGMPLIPCLVWAPFGLSDYLGERYSAWGEPKSKTRRFLAQYVPQVVNRYSGSAALMTWEFANEMNAYVDLPNGEQWFPPANPAVGCMSPRTLDDRITADDVEGAYAAFAALVRRTGDQHPISSGGHLPRYNQVNNAGGRWSPDTRKQLISTLKSAVAGQTDILSIHLYPDAVKNRFSSAGCSFPALLNSARTAADQRNAKLFVGEFGIPKSGNAKADRTAFQRLADAIKDAEVDYAAMWVFDYFDPNHPYNVTPTNDQAWMLDVLRAANA